MNDHESNYRFLDMYISPTIRSYCEETYYDRISEQASLENAIKDPLFLQDMESHIALYGDHGKTHARNVANLTLEAVDTINGVLIKHRDPYRLNFMKSFGVHLAFLHDIGMINFSDIGRATHPEFASQVIFSEDFDKYIDIIWNENYGNLSWRIMNLYKEIDFPYDQKVLLRECLSLVFTHSKSSHSPEYLNSIDILRAKIVDVLQHDLNYVYYRDNVDFWSQKLEQDLSKSDYQNVKEKTEDLKVKLDQFKNRKECKITKNNIDNLYKNFEEDSYKWLYEKGEEAQNFLDDVIDTLRVLRAADALRQRGQYSKTAAGYQMFVNSYNGKLSVIISDKHQRVFMLESTRGFNLGEANIHATKLTKDGNIFISFVTGFFKSDEALEAAAKATAPIVNSIYHDIKEAFIYNKSYSGIEEVSKNYPMLLLIENTFSNLHFSQTVGSELIKINPSLKDVIQYISPLSQVPSPEKSRYLSANPFTSSVEEKEKIIQELEKKGYKTARMDPESLFDGTRVYTLGENELLLSSGSEPGFAYLPFNEGLTGYPAGGFEPFKIPPYSIFGEASLISGTNRNATIICKSSLQVLIIPLDTYMTHWYQAYTPAELSQVLRKLYA